MFIGHFKKIYIEKKTFSVCILGSKIHKNEEHEIVRISSFIGTT
jgi:hypothetical protein